MNVIERLDFVSFSVVCCRLLSWCVVKYYDDCGHGWCCHYVWDCLCFCSVKSVWRFEVALLCVCLVANSY